MNFEVYKNISIFIYLIRLSGIDKVLRIRLHGTENRVEPTIKIPGIFGGVTARKREEDEVPGVSNDSVPCDGGAVFGFVSHSFSSHGEPLTFYLFFFCF